MERKVNRERKKVFYLENSMILYGIYNAETIETIVNTLKKVTNKTKWNEKVFVGKLTH